MSQFPPTWSSFRRFLDSRTPQKYLAIFALLAALVAPLVFTNSTTQIILQMIIFVLVVAGWNLIAGYFGVFNFAHAALFGVGGYTAAIFAGEFGITPIITILLGGFVAMLFSFLIAPVILRLNDSYVAMATLAYAEILGFTIYIFDDITGGAAGFINYPPIFNGNDLFLYYYTLTIVTVSLTALYVLLQSRFGLVGKAIRESEEAAKMLGNNTDRYKFYSFAIASIMAGIGGGLQAYTLEIFSPSMMELQTMIEIMAMAVIGGLGIYLGPLLGVVIIMGLSEGLRSIGDVRLLVWGILLMVIIIYFPKGILGRIDGSNHTPGTAKRIYELASKHLGGNRK